MMQGAKGPDELDHAADLARNIADRVILSLRGQGYAMEETKVKTVLLRETIQGVAHDALLYGQA
jgi:hypothetical protein